MPEPRLLVIDDSPTIRKLVELSFAASPWIVEFASSGSEGIEKATTSPPEAILLDFVLPDMRGTDVCRALAGQPQTVGTPIIIMSAKHDNVRELFEPFSAVAEFIGKPFAAADIVARVHGLLSRAPRMVAEKKDETNESGLSFEQKQAAAQALYAKLRHKFALIPQLMTQLDTAAPAAFFARKLLTPQLVDELFDALKPFFHHEVAKKEKVAPSSGAFEGTLGALPVIELLRLVTSGNREGELTLAYSDCEIVVSVRSGDIVLVTCDDPELCVRGDGAFGAPSPELLAKAELVQRSTEKPLPVALADACGVPESETPALIRRLGRWLLLHAASSPPQGFSWQPTDGAKTRAQTFLSAIPFADLELSVLRRPSVSGSDEDAAAVLSGKFTRGEHFSRRIRSFALSDSERQVLAVVDEQRTLGEIAERAELPATEVAAVANRLVRVGLLCHRDGDKRAELGPVLVADPDVVSFVAPLRKLLQESATPVRVVSVSEHGRLYDVIRSESPRMVIVNASAAGPEALRAAEAVRSDGSLAQPRLVALLETPAPDQAGRLTTAGYDAVFTKPVRRADLERLLWSQAG